MISPSKEGLLLSSLTNAVLSSKVYWHTCFPAWSDVYILELKALQFIIWSNCALIIIFSFIICYFHSNVLLMSNVWPASSMASFDMAASMTASYSLPGNQPIKRFEPSIHKFIKIAIPTDLERLNHHRRNIERVRFYSRSTYQSLLFVIWVW